MKQLMQHCHQKHLVFINPYLNQLVFRSWLSMITFKSKILNIQIFFSLILIAQTFGPGTRINDQKQRQQKYCRKICQILRSINYKKFQKVSKFIFRIKIISFISNIEIDNPDIASSYSAGKTYENRDLKVLVLKTSTSQKSVWIDCGIHSVNNFYIK